MLTRVDHVYRADGRVPSDPFRLYASISVVAPFLHGSGVGIARRGSLVTVRWSGDRPVLDRAGLRHVVTNPITPSRNLCSDRLVIRLTAGTWSAHDLRARVLAEAQRQLDALGGGLIELGEPAYVRVHGKKVDGFTAVVVAANDDVSLAVQERGIGGKRSMGCGVFFPC